MDKFVKDVVASVLGTPKPSSSTVVRPNYQRQKAQQRLVIEDITPSHQKHTTSAVSLNPIAKTAEPAAALRRTSMAALIPTVPADATPHSTCSQCTCSSSVTLHRLETPPRMLGELLGLRYCEGDSIISMSTQCTEITALIATDDLLIHQNVQPDAISYRTSNNHAWTLSFSAPTTLADKLEPQLRSLWQHCTSCGKSVTACAPSAKLLHQLGIPRQGAIGAVNGKSAADIAFALNSYLKVPHKINIYLFDHTAILQGNEEEINAGIEELSSIISRL